MLVNFTAVVSGCTIKTSSKGNSYVAINLLDDSGKSIGCMSRDLDLPQTIEKLRSYNCTADLTLGQYSKLEIQSMEPF